MTHGDKFRRLSDADLAKFLTDTSLCPPPCKEDAQKCYNCTNDYVFTLWLEYLGKEIEDNDQ